MKKISFLATVFVAAVVLMLAKPAVSHALHIVVLPPDTDTNPGPLNYLFDRWGANRRAANGEYAPFPADYRIWKMNNFYDYPIGNKLFDRWIDNRRARRGR